MFDDHNTDFDSMMKSVLENGQEEVPAHIWDGVSSSLDKMARRRKVLVFFRRSAVGTAIAACLALGLFLGHRQNSQTDLLTPIAIDSEMIAVVPNSHSDSTQEVKLLANVSDSKPVIETQGVITSATELICSTSSVAQSTKENNATTCESKDSLPKKDSSIHNKPTNGIVEENENSFSEFWDEEDEPSRNKIKTSLDFSGLAATNNSDNKKGNHIMKRPTLPNGQMATGITDNSTNSTFGIPLSFGAAVKVDFTPRWSLSVGARYTLLTRKFYGTFTKVNEAGMIEFTEASDIRNSQHYVGIPVNVYFNIVNRDYLKFYAYAGGAAEKCVRDQYQILSSRRTHIEVVKGLQWSVNAGIGVEFSAGKHLGIYIDPSLRYYFESNNQPKSLRTVKPLMLGFEAGLRVRL